MENVYTMGLVIREKRKELNLTQKELAENIGVSDKAVSKWERGESLPDVTLIPSIAVTLGISIDYLMTGKEYSGTEGESADKKVCSDTEQIKELSVQTYIQKADAKYLVATAVIMLLTLCGYYMMFKLPSSVYSFVSVTAALCFAAYIRPYNTVIRSLGVKDFGRKHNGMLCLAVAGSLFFGIIPRQLINYISDRGRFDRISITDVGIINIPVITVLSLYLILMVLNILFFDNGKHLRKNIIAASVGATAISAATAAVTLIKAHIIQNRKLFLLADYVKLAQTKQWIAKLESLNCILWIVTAVAVIAAFIFVKNKKDALISAVVMVVFGVYFSLCAANCVDYGGTVTKSYIYARMDMYSAVRSVYIAPVIPQLCIMLNNVTEKVKK